MFKIKNLSRKDRILYIAIAVVAILLVVMICLLVSATRKRGDSVTVGGNVLQGSQEQVIKLEHVGSEEEARIVAGNLFPGDSVKKSYTLEFRDSGVKAVHIAVTPRTQTGLAQLLDLLVTADTEVYHGALSDFPENVVVQVNDPTAPLTFEITVTLSTAVGNEWQNSEAAFDLTFTAQDSDYVMLPIEGENEGDGNNKLNPWLVILPILAALILLALILLLLLLRRRKKEPVPAPVPETPAPAPAPAPAPTPTPTPAPAPAPAPAPKQKRNKKYSATVTLDSIMRAFAPGEIVNIAALKAKGLVPRDAGGVKVLMGMQPIDRPLKVYANSFSAEAKQQIKAAGGEVHLL